MKTVHKIFYDNAKHLPVLENNCVDLVVTSPPYPMIQMWDDVFIKDDPTIRMDIESGNGKAAFEKMHIILDKIWLETDRFLKEGGIVCINIGDATRTLNKSFSLYPSHTRIVDFFYKRNYYMLPEILWRKQTNAPNKYMGSGMLPVGAYTTLEHEYILVLRKGNKKREFKSYEEKINRKASAFFWEERNSWFSDVWFDLKGVKQLLHYDNLRGRSASYPFELAYRLINMFSIKEDMVFDPFVGAGTTTIAAMVAGRNSIGVEIEENFKEIIEASINKVISFGNNVIENRIRLHSVFVDKQKANNKDFKYNNKLYNLPVVSKQENEIVINKLSNLDKIENTFFVDYVV